MINYSSFAQPSVAESLPAVPEVVLIRRRKEVPAHLPALSVESLHVVLVAFGLFQPGSAWLASTLCCRPVWLCLALLRTFLASPLFGAYPHLLPLTVLSAVESGQGRR